MRAIKNYYFILGISRGASPVEIEAVYASLRASAETDAIQASMMGEVEEAYKCLSNPARRREYDASMGETPQLSTSGYTSRPTAPGAPYGNIHQFKSAESSIALEIAFNKERNKMKFRNKFFKDIVLGIIFLGVAGAGIHYGMKYFNRAKTPSEAAVELFRVTKPAEPPQPEQPRIAIATARASEPVVRTYSMQSGGVVTTDKASCHSQPSSASRTTAIMRKDAVIFATKEVRGKDGSVWYYVSNSQFEGWANGRDVRIYKF
jgi:hypothetical protein